MFVATSDINTTTSNADLLKQKSRKLYGIGTAQTNSFRFFEDFLMKFADFLRIFDGGVSYSLLFAALFFCANLILGIFAILLSTSVSGRLISPMLLY